MTPRDVLGWVAAAILAAFMFGVLASACPAQSWPDSAQIVAAADSAGIDRRAALAIAWEETGTNLDPSLRGHACWYTADGRRHHERDCEIGRFQIKPSTARLRCAGLNVFTYAGNLACFVRMFAEDAQRGNTLYGGTLGAIRHHNGSGPAADAYVERILQTVGWIAVTEGI